MVKIDLKGNKNQVSTGDNSPIYFRNRIKKISKTGWFLTGVLLPLITGIILEIIMKGVSSGLLNKFIDLFR